MSAAILCASSPAWANSYSQSVTVETISDYTYYSGGSHVNDTDANTEGDGFYNAITASGSDWRTGIRWEDASVYDTDFYDPDLTGSSVDDDTYNFDFPWTGIAWAIGHGQCNDRQSLQTCSSDSDCGAGGYCPGGTSLNSGESRNCIYQYERTFVTSSAYSSHGNLVYYGNAYDSSPALSWALGEDAASGSFDSAGTNGGDNVVLITNSCGFRSHYTLGDTANFFGGMHALMFNMPTKSFVTTDNVVGFSDTRQWSSRGSNVATTILGDINAPMYMA